MSLRSSAFGLVLIAAITSLGPSACQSSSGNGSDMGEQIHINKVPTGSINTPSLCDRDQLDARVTTVAVDSFAFAWASGHYEVVYADLAAHDLYSMRVSEKGVPMETPHMIVSGTQASLPNLVMTTNGYVVTWEEGTSPPRASIVALDSNGAIVGTPQIVSTARGLQLRPVLTQTPTGLAVAWMDQLNGTAANTTQLGTSTTYVALLDSTLKVRTDVPKIQVDAASSTGYPWLAGDATQVGLMWSEQNSASTVDTYFELLDSTLTASAKTDVRDSKTATSSALLGRMMLTDFGYVATWEDNRDSNNTPEIYMGLLQTSGTLYAGSLVEEPNTGSANWPHVAWTGSALGVVYYQFRSGKPQIFMTFVDHNGTRIGGAADAQISDTSEWSRYPDITWTGGAFGVMWLDARNGEPEIYFNSASCQQRAPT